jgi:hypothetical protein
MPVCYPATDTTPARQIFVGCVLADRENNQHDDSDFYAVVWDDEKQEIANVTYASTRFAGGGSCVVDATDEVRAKADAWLMARRIAGMIEDDQRRAAAVAIGKRVVVVRGRKVRVGTEGLVFFLDERHFGSRAVEIKIGIALTDAKDDRGRYVDVAWTYARNVDVIDPDQYRIPVEEIEEAARRMGGRYVRETAVAS